MPNINDYGLPFTSQDGDRKYSALEWREYFSQLIHNGLIQNAANECQVKPQAVPNKTVYVDTGVVFINGAMRILDAPFTLAIAENTSENPRIDRVVARLNEASRTVEFAVKQGTPAGSPVAPALTRTEGVYELGLADITLANGYSTITSGIIADQRWNVMLCGASSMTIGVIPPSGLEAETVTLGEETSGLYGVGNVDATLSKISEFVNLKYKAFTSNGTFAVPEGVTSLLISGCAAGGDGAASGATGAKAGAYIINKPFNVTPGQTLTIVCGAGNTAIVELGISLVAASISTNHPNDKLGFAPSNGVFGGSPGTYISGQVAAGDGSNEIGGFKYPELFSNYTKSLGGGTGIYKGGDGGILGGGGGGPTSEGRTAGAGGGLCMSGGTGASGGAGGFGGAFGAGGGGGAGTATGCGGGAGGFGAGGGNGGGPTCIGGKGSPGFILIEW